MNILLLFFTYFVAVLLIVLLKKQRTVEVIASIATVIQIFFGATIINEVIQNRKYLYGYFLVDSFSALLLGITLLLGCIVTLYAIGYLRAEIVKKIISYQRAWQCYILLQIFLLLICLALTTTLPIVMWIAIEGTTLATVFLINFFQRPNDVEASWKFLIINTLGLLMALLGTFLFSAVTKGDDVITWSSLIKMSPNIDQTFIKYAFVFILIGYGTKMGLFPLHTWKPDAYNKGPIPFVALLSTVLLNVALYAILRFKVIVDFNQGSHFTSTLFIFFGVVSLVFASAVLFTQNNFKRFFAYSSIENAGLLLLAFGFGQMGVIAGLLHIIYHSLSKSMMFLVAGNIGLKYSSSFVKDVRDMVHKLPVTSLLFIVGFLSLTGVPPFGIFFSELSILMSGFRDYPVVVVISMCALILVFIGFFRITFSMVFGHSSEDIRAGEANLWTIFPLVILVGILIVFSIYLPTMIITLINQSQIILQ
ncbi:MAG: proton-conducting transporter membrane subunit [Candidatus Roizmanbacteria bacterium]